MPEEKLQLALTGAQSWTLMRALDYTTMQLHRDIRDGKDESENEFLDDLDEFEALQKVVGQARIDHMR